MNARKVQELQRAIGTLTQEEIAALCRQYRLPLLSQNRHFDSVPRIQRIPW